MRGLAQYLTVVDKPLFYLFPLKLPLHFKLLDLFQGQLFNQLCLFWYFQPYLLHNKVHFLRQSFLPTTWPIDFISSHLLNLMLHWHLQLSLRHPIPSYYLSYCPTPNYFMRFWLVFHCFSFRKTNFLFLLRYLTANQFHSCFASLYHSKCPSLNIVVLIV